MTWSAKEDGLKFEVDTGQVKTMVRILNAELQRISGDRRSLLRAVEDLGTMWEGAAHDAFAVSCIADDRELRDLTEDLQRPFDDMEQAGADYDKWENENRRLVSGIVV